MALFLPRVSSTTDVTKSLAISPFDTKRTIVIIIMSFVSVAATCDFPIQNLPYGIFTTPTIKHKRVGVAIGTFVRR